MTENMTGSTHLGGRVEGVDCREYVLGLAGVAAHHLDAGAFRELAAATSRQATRELLVFAGAGEVDRLAVEAWEIHAVARRGVACLEALDRRACKGEAIRPHLATALVAGLCVRESPVPFSMRVIDRQFAFVCDDSKEGGVMISSSEGVEFLRNLFVAHWRRGDRVRGAAKTGRLPVEIIDVLQEIAAGSTDDRAAVRLGLSLRTYRRRVDELMRLLQVETRFQAGAEATRRGLLDFLPSRDQPPGA